jgi:hypothetical protein
MTDLERIKRVNEFLDTCDTTPLKNIPLNHLKEYLFEEEPGIFMMELVRYIENKQEFYKWMTSQILNEQ